MRLSAIWVSVVGLMMIYFAGCMGDPVASLSGTTFVEVKSISVKDSTLVNTSVQVTLNCKAPDGCYHDLRFKITKTDAKHMQIRALGDFTQNGNCSMSIPSKDTVITFTPTAAGKYYFLGNQNQYQLVKDSLVAY